MKRIVYCRIWWCLLFQACAWQAGPLPSGADAIEPGQTRFTAEEFASRRAKVYDAIGDDLALLPGADRTYSYRRFRQHNNFYYLAGAEEPEAALLLDGRARQATLFLPDHRMQAVSKSVQENSGIEHVAQVSRFAEQVSAVLEGRKRVFLPRWPDEGSAQARDVLPQPGRSSRAVIPQDRRPSRAEDFRAGIKQLSGTAEVLDLEKVLDPLRRVKSPAEIAVMREAARVGAEAIAEAIRSTRPGILERELEGVCTTGVALFVFIQYL